MRKKSAWAVGIVFFLLLFTWAGSVIKGPLFSSPANSIQDRPAVPSHVIQRGPYGTNVSTTSVMGDCRYQIRAGQLYFTTTRMLVFENALWKKLVAKDLRLAVYQNGEKRIEFAKDKAALTIGMNPIRIKNPEILYPEHLRGATAIAIDRSKSRIDIFTAGGETITWQLNCAVQSGPDTVPKPPL